ncbi:phage head completion protein [Bacillus cereus]
MTIRWNTLSVTDRIIWSGRTYDITAIDKTTHYMRFLIIQTKAVI